MINVNPAVIEELDLSIASRGVLVLGAAGPSRRVGLRRGDFVRAVNGRDVDTVSNLAARLESALGAVTLTVERAGRTGQIRYNR